MEEKIEPKKNDDKQQTAVANLALFLSQLGSKTLVTKAKSVVELGFSSRDIAHLLKIEEGIELTEEQLNELSKKLLTRYHYASRDDYHARVDGLPANRHHPDFKPEARKINNRFKGQYNSADKMSKKPEHNKIRATEEFQQENDESLDELSKALLTRYLQKASQDNWKRSTNSIHPKYKQRQNNMGNADYKIRGKSWHTDQISPSGKVSPTRVHATEELVENCKKVSDNKLADRIKKAKRTGKKDKDASDEVESRQREIRKTLGIKELSTKFLNRYINKATKKPETETAKRNKRKDGVIKATNKIVDKLKEGKSFELINGKLRARTTKKRNKNRTHNLGEDIVAIAKSLRLKLNPWMNKKVRDSLIGTDPE